MLPVFLYTGLTVFIVSMSGVITPGPVLTVTVTESARKGFIAGPLIVIGHIMVEAVFIAALFFGLGLFLGSQTVRTLLGFAGGVTLSWMGYGLLKSAYGKELSLSTEPLGSPQDRGKMGSVFNGAVATLSNPYFTFWWAVVGGTLLSMSVEAAGTTGILIFAFSHWLADLSWYSFVSYCMGKGRVLMSGRIYRMIIAACGIFLIALGLLYLSESTKAVTQ